jgi:pyruvate dehydrogenase E1 component alpha subunit
MPGVVVDGNDFFAVYHAVHAAVVHARRGNGPTLIECKTMRMRGHAIHDNMAYVPHTLIAEWQAKDPIVRYEARLREYHLLDDARLAALLAQIEAEIDLAVAYAESCPYPDPATLTVGVYAEDSGQPA